MLGPPRSSFSPPPGPKGLPPTSTSFRHLAQKGEGEGEDIVYFVFTAKEGSPLK